MKRLLTIILSLLATTLGAQTLTFHQLTVKDGLPNNSIIALGQDFEDNLWVATPSGLCLYDGEQFTTIPIDHLPDKRIE